MIDLNRNEPCPECGRYSNRGVSIDAVIVRNKNILLIKRGIEPNKGLWGVPGGYVEWDESTEDAVRREVQEETGLNVSESKLVGVYSSPSRHPKQVINIVYLVVVDDGQPIAGDDAEEIQWFPLDSLPDSMALDHKQSVTDALNILSNQI